MASTDTDADAAFKDHEAFEATPEGYELTTTPFEGVVRTSPAPEAEGTTYRVVVTAPTLDAVVEGESVAEVVEEGWFETLERRLEHPHQAGRGLETIDPDVARAGDGIRVTIEFTSPHPERAAENVKALIEFVEGTWVQGIIPGYDYRDPAASFLEQATENYDENESGI